MIIDLFKEDSEMREPKEKSSNLKLELQNEGLYTELVIGEDDSCNTGSNSVLKKGKKKQKKRNKRYEQEDSLINFDLSQTQLESEHQITL